MNLNPFAPIFDLVDTALDKFFPDADAEEKRGLEKFLTELRVRAGLIQGQLEINKEEAKHGSIFVAGWRPFIGWVCGCGLVYNFILHPLLCWGLGMLQAFEVVPFAVVMADKTVYKVIAPPSLDLGVIISLLSGMLGLGAIRSYEKKNGVARLSIKGGV